MRDEHWKATTGTFAGGLGGFWVGAMIGFGLALLFTPTSGPEMRRRLRSTVQGVGDRAQEMGQQVRGRFERAGQAVRRGMDEFGRQTSEAERTSTT